MRTERQYIFDEWQRALNDIAKCKNNPLAERREDTQRLLSYVKDDINLIDNALTNLMNGSYGQGALIQVYRILKMSNRTNKKAMLFQMIAALEFQVPQRECNWLYNQLDDDQKTELNDMIQSNIDFRLEEDLENGTLINTDIIGSL